MTIVVPVLNEAEYIRDCVRSIADQTYPPSLLEVIFVEGGSTDCTRTILESEASALLLTRWTILVNPKGGRSSSLNLGLAAAKNDVLVRIDARSRPSPNYVAGCVDVLERHTDVGVVGGAQLALPRSGRASDLGIARALQNRWATGLSRYRLGFTSGASDTAWLGAFRTSELRALGGWNVQIDLNEDYELNERFRTRGAIVWFEAGLRTGYVPRADLTALGRQYFQYGRAKGMRWRAGADWRPRHIFLIGIPPGGLLLALALARRLGLVRAALVLVAGIGMMEASGGAAVKGGPLVRASSTAAMATIAGSWWIGVVHGLVDRSVTPAAPRRH